ncbi:MAG: AtpZ/AtpI family protein [Pseudomonadota bacterium]|nr:AtpZ/AtpI family protein [Pseudomonadota bacterium]
MISKLPKDLRNLQEKIEKIELDLGDKNNPEIQKSMSYGLRVGIELVVAVALGVLIGIFFDELFDTGPLLMILFLFLGFAAGINNIMKQLNSLNKDKQG